MTTIIYLNGKECGGGVGGINELFPLKSYDAKYWAERECWV